jgi:hypothetical protein
VALRIETRNDRHGFSDRALSVKPRVRVYQHKELWFRGEGRDYGKTILRPELYRAAGTSVSSKRILKLLDIENDLHNEFQRAADERYGGRISEENWDWDSYFLMKHHEGPTRLLDWSDGALMALHFAVRIDQTTLKMRGSMCSNPTS